MGKGALEASSEEAEAVSRSKGQHTDSPALRLLDALRAGDLNGVLAVCGDTTTVSAENMRWSCRGRAQIQDMLQQAMERFPGLTFESHTRHVGFGLVIDEARVRDEAFEAPAEDAAEPDTPAVPDPSVHPMWDEPVTEKRTPTWGSYAARTQPPTRLDLPVRVTVRHDDLQVHEVALSFPAALLKRALGVYVDPFEMSLSEVQSAFIAPAGAGFTTYDLARPELKLVPPPPAEAPQRVTFDEEPPRRRRGRVLLPLLVVLLALVGGGIWYAVQGQGASPSAGPGVGQQHHRHHTTSPSPSAGSTASASSSKAPTVTHAKPRNVPSHKPNITLKSDLAFGFNSAQLSDAAKQVIDNVAHQVRTSSLQGKIYVDGYTDNLGSAAYGIVLSQRRADAVSNYLGSQLLGVTGITIVSVGHGEADPIGNNATQAGRQANRRVTITLPKT